MKETAVILIFCCIPSLINAQSHRFGLKSGIAVSSFSQQETELGNFEIEWQSRVAYQTGIFYNSRLKESLLSFQFELDYKKVGTGFNLRNVDPNFDSGSKAEYNFEYVGFSILPRVDLFPEKTLNPNFMFGGVLDIRTDSKLLLRSESGADTSLTRNSFIGGDLDKRTNELLFGYVMAGGIEISTNPVIITIEARYSSLFSKVFNESVEEMPLNNETYLVKIMEDSRSNYFSFLLGFNFYF